MTALIRNQRFDHAGRWNFNFKAPAQEVDAGTRVLRCRGNGKGDGRQRCRRKLKGDTALGNVPSDEEEPSKGRCLILIQNNAANSD